MATAALTVDVFNAGIEVPEASVLVIFRSTASKAVFHQQLGRDLTRTPSTADVAFGSKEGRCASVFIYAKRFGSFAEALVAAGVNSPGSRKG